MANPADTDKFVKSLKWPFVHLYSTFANIISFYRVLLRDKRRIQAVQAAKVAHHHNSSNMAVVQAALKVVHLQPRSEMFKDTSSYFNKPSKRKDCRISISPVTPYWIKSPIALVNKSHSSLKTGASVQRSLLILSNSLFTTSFFTSMTAVAWHSRKMVNESTTSS